MFGDEMHALTKKWEVVLLPIVLLIAFSMICTLEGCKNDTDNDADENRITKPKIEKKPSAIDKDEPKTNEAESRKTETEPKDETKKPDDDEKTTDIEKKSDYTGEVVISLSNNTYGYVLPCG